MPAEPTERAKAQDRRWSTLMAAAQSGDGRAYAELLEAVTPFVRVLAGRRISDTDAVEDVVQETLLTVHRIRHTYDPRRPFTPWIAAIADRRSVDAVRRRSRLADREKQSHPAYETFPDPAANKQVEAVSALAAASALIEALPAQQRQALELVKVQEMSLVEASAASGQSVASLKVNVHRAIKRLRRLTGLEG